MGAIEFIRLEPMPDAQSNLHMNGGVQKNDVHELEGSSSWESGVGVIGRLSFSNLTASI